MDPDEDPREADGTRCGWSDAHTPISVMRTAVGAFIEARDWRRYHHPVNVASAMAVEAGELLELFQWRRPGDPVPPQVVEAAGPELADTLHFALCLANALDSPLEWDDLTLGEIVGGEPAPEGGAKGAAEEVLSNASLALMAARARFGPGGSGVEGGGAVGQDAVMVAVEMTVSSLAICASALGLDLARELELKNRLNEDRFPVGTRPDVGY